MGKKLTRNFHLQLLGGLGIKKTDKSLRGLGELICLKFAQEGCNVAINYNSSADRAKGVAEKVEKEHGVKAFLIQGVSDLLSTQE